MAIEACKKLKDTGLNFKWYVFLLDVNSNPYPFIKNADIYVQTSCFEGFGLAIAEAEMVNVPGNYRV